MRRVGATTLGASAVGAAGLQASTQPANALVISGTAALLAGGAIAGAAAGAGLAYLARDEIESILGQGEDLSGYTGKEALRTQIEEQSLTMQTVDERVFTSIKNNLANSETVAFAKGKVAALEKMNAEAPEADAVTAMEEAVDGYYSTIQKNIFTHWETQTSQIDHHVTMAVAHQDVWTSDWFTWKTFGVGSTERGTTSVTLVSGETYEVETLVVKDAGTNFPDGGTKIEPRVRDGITDEEFVFTGAVDGVTTLRPYDYHDLLKEVSSRSTSVKTKLGGFVGDLYFEYGAGDIPTEDVIDPVTAATQLSQNTGMAGQAAEAAMLGIPTSASFSLLLELQDANGNTFEVDAELYTTASPTDGSGNDTGWEVGVGYDPANFDAPIYVAYEYIDTDTGEKSSNFIQIDEPFTVIDATDEEGNEVTNIVNEERVTQTADVTKLEEELAQLRDEQQRLQEESQSQGGATIGSSSFSTEQIIAGVVGTGLAAFLLGK
jgi:hypothetical protein